ncbi:MAG: pyridoxamine 5'-phosphate oxidase [Verrucomicrobiota bacterium]
MQDLRRDYRLKSLELEDLDSDPFRQFRTWFDQACEADLLEPNAMTLACSDSAGKVSARTVLLKDFDNRGFVFFTNYGSRKSKALEALKQAAILFPWLPLERQVEIQGTAEKISRKESLDYFQSRPHGSQLGAWASQQSQTITSRSQLERKLSELEQTYKEGQVPLPEFWGGWRIIPLEFEFWQGRANRLHDRFRYEKDSTGTWSIRRLSP